MNLSESSFPHSKIGVIISALQMVMSQKGSYIKCLPPGPPLVNAPALTTYSAIASQPHSLPPESQLRGVGAERGTWICASSSQDSQETKTQPGLGHQWAPGCATLNCDGRKGA